MTTRKYYAAAAATAAVILSLQASPGAAATRLDFFIHDTSQVVIGSVLTFHGQIFTHKGGDQIGRFGGTCTTLAPGAGLKEDLLCAASFDLPKGQLALQGIFSAARFYGGEPVTLGVLGGTGAYRDADGDGTVRIPNRGRDTTDGAVSLAVR